MTELLTLLLMMSVGALLYALAQRHFGFGLPPSEAGAVHLTRKNGAPIAEVRMGARRWEIPIVDGTLKHWPRSLPPEMKALVQADIDAWLSREPVPEEAVINELTIVLGCRAGEWYAEIANDASPDVARTTGSLNQVRERVTLLLESIEEMSDDRSPPCARDAGAGASPEGHP